MITTEIEKRNPGAANANDNGSAISITKHAPATKPFLLIALSSAAKAKMIIGA